MPNSRYTQALRFAPALILVFSQALVACAQDEQAPKLEVEVQEDVIYGQGGGHDLLLDVVKPAGLTEPAPAVIVIHGGGWAGGSRKDFRPVCQALAERGYVTTTIDYRLVPEALFPAQVEDCKCAVRWMRAHAEELQLDPERIGALGGSAGGHLVMMLGTMDAGDGLEGDGGWADQSSKVQAVVNLSGPADFMLEYPPVSRQIVANFLGGPKEEHEDVYRQASPVTYVNEGDSPMLILQGTKDPLVPHDQAFAMINALTAAGVPGRAELLLGLGHGWGGEEMLHTMNSIYQFLDAHLRK